MMPSCVRCMSHIQSLRFSWIETWISDHWLILHKTFKWNIFSDILLHWLHNMCLYSSWPNNHEWHVFSGSLLRNNSQTIRPLLAETTRMKIILGSSSDIQKIICLIDPCFRIRFRNDMSSLIFSRIEWLIYDCPFLRHKVFEYNSFAFLF